MKIQSDKKQTKDTYKIAFFGQKRIFTREGGIEIVVEELATRMAALGHDVTCINRRGHHVSGAEFDVVKVDEYKDVKIQTVPTIDKKGLAAVSASFFATMKAAFGRYDIVHIHAEGPAIFCFILKLTGKKVICTCHGLDHRRKKWEGSIGRKIILLGEKMMARYADEIIVLSKDMQKYFMDTYARDTVFIPNGTFLPMMREPRLIKEYYDLMKDSYILALARLTVEKQIHLLIQVYRKINTDMKLVIAGGSSDSEEYVEMLHEMAKGDDRIIFTGFVQGQMLEELYSNAYIYVLPSEIEGMPLCLLEAMGYGNCCLTSDISECTDVLGDNGVSFNVNDIQDLEAKLSMLIDNPELVGKYKQMTINQIGQKCSWDEVVDRTIELYQNIYNTKK